MIMFIIIMIIIYMAMVSAVPCFVYWRRLLLESSIEPTYYLLLF